MLALFVAADTSFSQTYSIVPNDTIQITGMLEDLETLSIEQLNTSQDTIVLQWQKVSESVPPAWDADVCDNVICYTALEDSGVMNPVIPGDYGFLLLHITSHVNYGTAIVRYAVWDTANAALKDTLTYILTVSPVSGIGQTEKEDAFSIFVDPAQETIHITSNLTKGFRFLITDISGKQIQDGVSKTDFVSISTQNMSNGVYSVSCFNKVIATKKIVVNH